MRLQALTACVVGAVALAGCGGDERPGPTTVVRSTGASPSTTAVDPAGPGAASERGAAGGPPAATPAEVAAIPTGLVPEGPADQAEAPAVIDDLRARLRRSPEALRRVGTARYDATVQLLGSRSRASGRADFRSGESLGTLRLDRADAVSYNDGTESFVRIGSSTNWVRNTPLLPNAPGNSPRIYAANMRVGRAGAEQTIGGVRCRWAAGVIPLRQLLDSAGVAETPRARNVLRLAKPDARFPTAACVARDGLVVGVRIDVAFGRDLGFPEPAAGQAFKARLDFSAFGRTAAIERPAGLPAD